MSRRCHRSRRNPDQPSFGSVKCLRDALLQATRCCSRQPSILLGFRCLLCTFAIFTRTAGREISILDVVDLLSIEAGLQSILQRSRFLFTFNDSTREHCLMASTSARPSLNRELTFSALLPLEEGRSTHTADGKHVKDRSYLDPLTGQSLPVTPLSDTLGEAARLMIAESLAH